MMIKFKRLVLICGDLLIKSNTATYRICNTILSKVVNCLAKINDISRKGRFAEIYCRDVINYNAVGI